MTVDNTKFNYRSAWDIDQLIAQGSVAVGGAGDTTLYTITSSAVPNVFEVLFQPTGETSWYQAGTSSTSLGAGAIFTFYAYINASSLIIHTGGAGTARYYVWSDKVNY